tara:strand:- start:2430 stop:2840 length:411 start_codon:yes stop_codon:yes gene_type:complete
MALSTAKYEAIHNKTGSDLASIKSNFDNGQHLSVIDFPAESAILYQIQKMQDELDYLRGIIDANNDKVSMTLGTTGSTALAGDTNIVTIGSSTTIAFGDMITTTTTDKKGNTVTSYSIVMTVTNGGVSKTITHTLT